MSLTQMWIERGKAQGFAMGKAEGRIETVIETYKLGMLSSANAHARLKFLAEQGMAPLDLVEKALLEIAD